MKVITYKLEVGDMLRVIGEKYSRMEDRRNSGETVQ